MLAHYSCTQMGEKGFDSFGFQRFRNANRILSLCNRKLRRRLMSKSGDWFTGNLDLLVLFPLTFFCGIFENRSIRYQDASDPHTIDEIEPNVHAEIIGKQSEMLENTKDGWDFQNKSIFTCWDYWRTLYICKFYTILLYFITSAPSYLKYTEYTQ